MVRLSDSVHAIPENAVTIARRMLVLSVVQGLATTFSQHVGFLAGIAIGISMAVIVWSHDHPIIWWYDLFFAAIVASVALVSSAIYGATCYAVSVTGYALSTCAQFAMQDAVRLHLGILCATSYTMWLVLRLWAWRLMRQ